MTTVTIHQAKTHLSELLRRVSAGEEIVIARGKDPIARLVPAGGRRVPRFGTDRGKFTVPDDFDAPLPETTLRLFEA